MFNAKINLFNVGTADREPPYSDSAHRSADIQTLHTCFAQGPVLAERHGFKESAKDAIGRLREAFFSQFLGFSA